MFDEHDAGLFKSHESTLDSWKLIVDTKNWKIEQIRRADDSDLRVSLEQFSAIEESSKGQIQRFPWLLRSERGFTVDVNRCARDTSIYKNVDMTVKFTCGAMDVNWRPKAVNRLLKFLRLNKFKRFAYKQWLGQALFRFKQMKLMKKEKEAARRPPGQQVSDLPPDPEGEGDRPAVGESKSNIAKKIQNCETDP